MVDGADEWGWGLVVSFAKLKQYRNKPTDQSTAEHYIVDVLLRCATGSVGAASADGSAAKPRPCTPWPAVDGGDQGELHVVPVAMGLLAAISSIRLFMPKDLRSADQRGALGKTVQVVLERKEFVHGVPELDMITDMRVREDGLKGTIRKIEALEGKLTSNKVHGDTSLEGAVKLYGEKMAAKDAARAMKRTLKQQSEMILKEELKGMKRVLRRLGMLNSDNVVEAKGRVACEIDSADELVVTELIFNNSFSDLTVEQLVALCSCFVFGEKAKDDAGAGLEDALATPLRMLQDVARRVGKLKIESKLACDETEYVNTFDPSMMKVAYEWCKGAKFCDVIKLTDIFEGSIIRAMRRLEELLRQLCGAANSIGNEELEAKFNEGIRLIKRDIVFCASLYL